MPTVRLILLLLFSQTSLAIDWQQLNWQTAVTKEQITVSTAKVAQSKYKAIRTEMLLKTDLLTVLSLIIDARRCKDWVHRCYRSSLYEQLSPSKYLQYFVSKPPWPLKKRDFLLEVEVSQQTDLSVNITAKAANNIMPPRDKIVRITETESLWTLTPLPNGYIRIENYAHVQPNDMIPAWLSNKILTNIPFTTLKNMRNIIQTGEVKKLPLEFIQVKE